MSLTNEIKRLRNKLKIFDCEGITVFLGDFIDHLVDSGTIDTGQLPEWKKEDIKNYKANLQKKLDDLLSQQQKVKQGKLNL